MLTLPALPRLRTTLLVIAGFFVAGFLVYGWSLHNEFVRWDDGMLIYENPVIRQINPSTLRWIFTHFDPELYIPLTFFTYQLDFLIGGMDPFQYHLDNLVLHILNAVLTGYLLFALFRRRWLAVFCGALFLLHPLNTEAVEWASGRKDVLSTFFLLASIATYFLYQSRAMAGSRSSRRWYIISLVLFTCGLLSKVMIITLPVVLIFLDYARERKFDRAFFLDKIPYGVLSVIFGLIGILGKETVITSSSPVMKFLMAFKSTVFYIQQYIWPTRLSLLYPYNGEITLASPDFFVPFLIVIVLLGAAVFFYKRQRFITVGLLFYFVTVAPTLLNFTKGEMDLYFASDRYAYVPQIGFIIILAALIVLLTDRLQARIADRAVQTGGLVFGALLLCVLGGLSYKQSLTWKDTRSLFQNVIEKYPDASYVAYNNLCNADRLANDLVTAVADCTKSLEMRPHAKTYTNLGAIYRRQKNYDGAIDMYTKAIALDPASSYAHFGMGIVYAERGQYDLAEAQYLKAAELRPNYTDVFVNLGALYAVEGRYEEAVTQYRKALEINTFSVAALYNLAVAETELGNTDDAMEHYERALSVEPAMIAARINLALLLHGSGDADGAVRQFREILLIDPQNATALSALRQLGEQ